jgi:hypothetical protein
MEKKKKEMKTIVFVLNQKKFTFALLFRSLLETHVSTVREQGCSSRGKWAGTERNPIKTNPIYSTCDQMQSRPTF